MSSGHMYCRLCGAATYITGVIPSRCSSCGATTKWGLTPPLEDGRDPRGRLQLSVEDVQFLKRLRIAQQTEEVR